MNKDMIPTTMAEPPLQNTFWKKLGLPVCLLAMLAAGYATGLHRYFTLDAIVENRSALSDFTSRHFISAVLAFAGIYVLAVAISFPGASVLTILGGFLFGGLMGAAIAAVAATIGAIIVFQIARSAFGNVLAKRAGPLMASISKGFSDDAFNYLLFLRLVPAFPFWLVNIAPALANVKLRTFATTTVVGIIPGTLAFSFVGAGLDSVISAQQAEQASCTTTKSAEMCSNQLDISALVTPELLLAFAGLGVVALIPVALRKWKLRHV